MGTLFQDGHWDEFSVQALLESDWRKISYHWSRFPGEKDAPTVFHSAFNFGQG